MSGDLPANPPVMSGDLPDTPSDPPANPPVMSGDPLTTSNDPPATSPAKSGDLPLTNGHKSDSLSKASSESELSEKHESNVTTDQQEVDAYGREINEVGGGSGGFDSLFETARSLGKGSSYLHTHTPLNCHLMPPKKYRGVLLPV